MEPIVVIIDSGIRATLIGERLIDSISFQKEEQEVDRSGHGTACAIVIKSICPDSKFISISILDAEGFTSSQILREALEYCLTIDCHIINLSLSLLDEDNYEIKEICDELLKQNKVVVSAVRNRYKLSEPAIFDSVLGVRGSLFPSPNEFWFNSHKTIQLITDMTPVFTNPELGKYFVFSGNSKATAVGSGLVARTIMLENYADIKDIYRNLSNKCIKSQWIERELQAAISSHRYKRRNAKFAESNVVYAKIEQLIRQVSTTAGENIIDETLKANDSLFEMGIMVPETVVPLIQALEEEFRVRLDLKNITPFMLETISCISDTLRGVKNKTDKNDITNMEIHKGIT
ncbi:hypothetical protein BSK62_15090 [Paenibacillus odorifer]|uniref:Peptidase S8/S53 domain-containing protein n=1 Tax=Paenibacillus odorifer TaxID=189426 RepID=A0ABX3GFA2_9BACL|nr:S8 family serine peptidase [Paenibacillus odorifer]OMC68103.1 hypothetical protein BK121_18575 [Paenibacillus odorifer]OMC75924.1 hypothetical protein BK125_19900 [Paenibacillus odorifer]OMD11944.1 hypothetical protein BSO21_28520 [Paenibacillus odorifer]OMD64933.1 hypothetical protein BSK62_15090 [Paenibacillus odorifer]OMD95869.1 hypothetical protein BSK54_25705 [Paenibacillus odorifer]